MSRFLLALAFGLVVGGSALAQPSSPAAPSASESVRATLASLFDGMRAGDSAAVRQVFHPNARLHTAVGSGDTSSVQSTSVDAFVEAVGRPHERVWDERIWDVEIRVDGPLASAWVPYVFYLGDERSHCGVNAVQFVRHSGRWVILQLTDTRRSTCDVPAEVQK